MHKDPSINPNSHLNLPLLADLVVNTGGTKILLTREGARGLRPVLGLIRFGDHGALRNEKTLEAGNKSTNQCFYLYRNENVKDSFWMSDLGFDI